MSAESGMARRRRAALADSNAAYRARRAEVIEVAARIFNEKGYEVATLSDIAERLGTDRASLYYYFESKQEIFQTVIRGVLDENLAEADRILATSGMSSRDKIISLVETILASYERNYPHMFVYIEEGMRTVADAKRGWARDMAQQTRRLEKILMTLLATAQAEGDLRQDISVALAANALFGMLNWTSRWFRPGPNLTAREMTEAFTAIFFEGMSASSVGAPKFAAS